MVGPTTDPDSSFATRNTSDVAVARRRAGRHAHDGDCDDSRTIVLRHVHRTTPGSARAVPSLRRPRDRTAAARSLSESVDEPRLETRPFRSRTASDPV